jgi:VWFA-related protein
MLRTIRYLHLILVVSVLFPSWLWSQQKTSAPPMPIPDFSGAVDLTEHHPIEYQEYEKGLLTFSTKAQYVLVPAVVTDKEGNPVTGLKKEDFRLQENGKDQAISSIDEIVPIAAPLSNHPVENKNEASNELSIENRAPRRLIIIAIDMVNTPFLDQLRARQQVISYLANSLEPTSLYQVVVVENNGLRVLHDYTQSSADLIATVKNVRSRFTAADRVDNAALSDFNSKGDIGASTVTPGATSIGPSGNAYSLRDASGKIDIELWAAAQSGAAERPYAQSVAAAAAESTLTAFHQLAQRTSGVPGRKSLVWITGSFPFTLDPATARFSGTVWFGIYQHVMQELSDQMIAVYPVDARGLLTSNVDATLRVTRTQLQYPGAMAADSSNRQRDILDTMHTFADMTGGRAYLNTNDTAGAVRAAALDGAHYYLLSYPVDKNNRRQGWRKISLKAGHYNVRARQGYYLTQATVDPLASAKFDIDAALRSPLDYTGVPLRVLLKSRVDADGKKKVPFSTVIPSTGVRVDTADNNHVFIEISYAVLSADGNSTAKQDKSYNLNLNAEQMKQFTAMGLGFTDSVELAPGSQKLRVVVRDNLSGRVGSVLADIHAD